MLCDTVSIPPLIVYQEVQCELHAAVRFFFLDLLLARLILGWVRLGLSSSRCTYSRPPVMVVYSAAGLISASSPYFSDYPKSGVLIFTITCSTSFFNVSTLRLVGGHSVILVKIFLITASKVLGSNAASLAGDVMAFSFSWYR